MDFIGRCGTSTALMRLSGCKQNVSAVPERGGLVFQGISLRMEHKTGSHFFLIGAWRTEHLHVALSCEERTSDIHSEGQPSVSSRGGLRVVC